MYRVLTPACFAADLHHSSCGSAGAGLRSSSPMPHEQASAGSIVFTVVLLLKCCPMQVSVCWRITENHAANASHICARNNKVEMLTFCGQFPSKTFKIHRIKIYFEVEVISAVPGSCHCSCTAKVQLTEPSSPVPSPKSGAASAGPLSCSTRVPFLLLFSVPP